MKDGLWLRTSSCWSGDPVLAPIDCCISTGCVPGVGLATREWGGGVCSLRGCIPAALMEPQGETGVDGGVNGLNPDVDFLSQALDTG